MRRDRKTDRVPYQKSVNKKILAEKGIGTELKCIIFDTFMQIESARCELETAKQQIQELEEDIKRINAQQRI